MQNFSNKPDNYFWSTALCFMTIIGMGILPQELANHCDNKSALLLSGNLGCLSLSQLSKTSFGNTLGAVGVAINTSQIAGEIFNAIMKPAQERAHQL